MAQSGGRTQEKKTQRKSIKALCLKPFAISTISEVYKPLHLRW